MKEDPIRGALLLVLTGIGLVIMFALTVVFGNDFHPEGDEE